MRRLYSIAVVYIALFGIGYAGALLDGRPGATDVAYAAPCVGSFSVNVNNTCGSPGWAVFAQVTHCQTSVPSAVRADVYDSGGGFLETIFLNYVGMGVWNGVGTCRNPQTAATVTFTASNGVIDQPTGFANDSGCGSC
jgi:hypothetical protein